MSDEIRANISAMAKALRYYPSGPSNVNSCCPGIGRCEMDAAIAEIARLRAACDAYSKTISLSALRHGRILVGLERRNARQRRVLAKLYQRRHDKNVALANARREGMAEAAKITLKLRDEWRNPEQRGGVAYAEAIAAAIRAAAKEDRQP